MIKQTFYFIFSLNIITKFLIPIALIIQALKNRSDSITIGAIIFVFYVLTYLYLVRSFLLKKKEQTHESIEQFYKYNLLEFSLYIFLDIYIVYIIIFS